jgi:starch phosphorylase
MVERTIAYFSMEIALEDRIPTYAGGLGILAGDTIRSAADLQVPMVAVSLVHKKGYFKQQVDSSGTQFEETLSWDIGRHLELVSGSVAVQLDAHTVHINAWKYEVKGITGHVVPVYLLDTDRPENDDWFRSLTDSLYGHDYYYRICQEAVLGIGGVRMLRELGFLNIRRFHLNEGHSSLLGLELLDEERLKTDSTRYEPQHIDAVRKKCVFTTHTPVPAGHDQFQFEEAARILGLSDQLAAMKDVFCFDGRLNMTHLALNLSHYVNGVAKSHGKVSRSLFPQYSIDSITNGVHTGTWVGPDFSALFDRCIPGWREDNFSLRYALSIPREEMWDAHTKAKNRLIQYIHANTQTKMNVDYVTLGFARRFAGYKRGDLLFSNPDRLNSIAESYGALQIVYAGKAHPGDEEGKAIIRRIFEVKKELGDRVKIAFLENYDMEIARLMVAGVDVWVNTPQPPMEASGTSGMKAAVNGVPSLSVRDGWWVEGHIENVTGWSVGDGQRNGSESEDRKMDADSLYQKLESSICPLIINHREQFVDVMRHCIALNGSFFNTQRMVQQYVLKAYFC